jgi:hypothetical protein
MARPIRRFSPADTTEITKSAAGNPDLYQKIPFDNTLSMSKSESSWFVMADTVQYDQAMLVQ